MSVLSLPAACSSMISRYHDRNLGRPLRDIGARPTQYYSGDAFEVSTSMGSKMISVSIPEEMLPEIDQAALHENRSRSELIREALRRYLSRRRHRMIPLDDAQPDEIEAIERGREQFTRGDFVRLEDLQR